MPPFGVLASHEDELLSTQRVEDDEDVEMGTSAGGEDEYDHAGHGWDVEDDNEDEEEEQGWLADDDIEDWD